MNGGSEALKCGVRGGVVGGAVLPASPDDVAPGAGEDAGCVLVGLAVGAEPVVAGFGPWFGAPTVTGDVAEGVSGLVGAMPERDYTVSCAGANGGCCAREADEGFRRGESGATVAHLGDERCGADRARAWERREDVSIGVAGEQLRDAVGELGDLGNESLEQSDEGEHDRGAGAAIVVDSARRGSKAPVELGCGLAAAVAVGAEPGIQALLGEPRGSRGEREPLAEAQAGRAVEVAEEADGAGEHDAVMGAELVAGSHAGFDQILAGSNVRPQRHRRRGVGLQAPPAVAVGTRAVGQDVGVGAVRLVARGPIALAEGFDRPARHDYELEAGVHESIDNGAVGAFDGDAGDSAESPAQLAQAVGGVLDDELGDHAAVGVHDVDGVGVGSPVHSAVAVGGIIQVSRLAVAAGGKHPGVHGRVCRSLTGRRSLALSRVASRHVLGRRPWQNACWRSDRKRDWRCTDGHQGCAGSLTATEKRMVDP